MRGLAGRLPLPTRRPLPGREAAPLALLLLALSSVFVFGGDRSYFYRPGNHDWSSGHTLALSANLSAEHGFLLFQRRKLDAQGEPRYASLYHRYPIGNYALVKLAIAPFGDDIPRQIMAARLLMLAFFAAAAVLAYLALARLLGDRPIASAATLLAFSPYYLLHYADAISDLASTDLFGIALVFHGMALYAREGRYRQLLVKTAVALPLGWHVLALIAPFVLFGLGRELLRLRPAGDGGGGATPRPRPYLAYGAFSALCAALLLGFNLGNEWRAFGGEVSPLDLPTVGSLLARSGLDAAQSHVGELGWATFLRGQFGGAGGMAIPFAFVDRLDLGLAKPNQLWPPEASAPWFAALGAGVFAVCLAGLRFLPCRALFAALLLAGWCWAIPFRGATAVHEFYAMFHLGVPLVFWSLALLGLRRLLGPRQAARALPAAALAAAALFALSAWDTSRTGHDAEAALRQREIAADVEAIRALAAGRSVLVSPANHAIGRFARNYYLAGSYIQIEVIGSPEEWPRAAAYDFVLAPVDAGGSSTPGNRRLHLYRPAALDLAWDAIAARAPALRAAFGLHLDGRTLTWAREPCSADHTGPPFFVEAAPLGGRPAERFEFGFRERGVLFGGKCLIRFELPDYALAGLRTGQRQGGLPPVWEASLPAADPSFPRGASVWFDAATAAEPAVRGPFDAYLDGRTLTLVREACSGADVEPRFSVHAYAANAGDLPAERREAGFETLDFWFRDRGVRYGGGCMAQIALPDYALRSVRTSQYDDGGHLWDAEFALGAEAWLARFEALAAREPDARRAGFALHLEGRTLTLAREGCSAADVADRFFVHAYAPDGGREAIDFWFRQRGERHGDRCMASVGLPPSAARVVAGQYDASGHLWEAVLAPGE